jgi:GntR family transcriptional regulator, transcriptional repressor for pyruvate dehydrogenase complex
LDDWLQGLGFLLNFFKPVNHKRRMRPESVRQVSNEGSDGNLLLPSARLGDRLSQRMAALIDRGELGERGRLPPESELAARFGVSRPVIREALSRLRVMGVIVSRKGSGSYVQKRSDRHSEPPTIGFGPVSSLAQVRKCYEFRVSIEGDAAYYAAQNRTADNLLTMKIALDGMESATTLGALGLNPDMEFHFAVARASGNEFFEAVMEAMRIPLEFAVNLARSLTLTRPLEHLLIVQAEHVAMFEAIEAGDKEAARIAMRTHIENARSRIFEGPGMGRSEPELHLK